MTFSVMLVLAMLIIVWKAWCCDSNGPKEVINCIVWVFSQSHKRWHHGPEAPLRRSHSFCRCRSEVQPWRTTEFCLFVIVTLCHRYKTPDLADKIRPRVCNPSWRVFTHCSSVAAGWLETLLQLLPLPYICPWRDWIEAVRNNFHSPQVFFLTPLSLLSHIFQT